MLHAINALIVPAGFFGSGGFCAGIRSGRNWSPGARNP
jgi:hypothetical protein